MSLVQFFGGPLDGQSRELPDPLPTLWREPWFEHRTGTHGEHTYRLSDRYKLPPYRYDFVPGPPSRGAL